MAGSYPDAPSNRMVLDRDGTQMFRITATNALHQLSAAQVEDVNDEESSGYPTDFGGYGGLGSVTLVALFPEKRDLAGYYLNSGLPTDVPARSNTVVAAEVSTNTTNGVDGTWTAITIASHLEPISPNFRSKIQAVNAPGVRGVRFKWTIDAAQAHPSVSLHLYGATSAGQALHRLAFWHPVNDARISGAYLDWGDTPRSSSADRSLRIKNLSASKTAENIVISFHALTDGIPAVASQFTISENAGVSFAATATLASLAPGGITPELVIRRNTPVDAALSVWEPRIIAAAANWSG